MHLAFRCSAAALIAVAALACTPKAEVHVKPPDEPIVINVNVKIEHEIRVKVDEELDDLFAQEGDLF